MKRIVFIHSMKPFSEGDCIPRRYHLVSVAACFFLGGLKDLLQFCFPVSIGDMIHFDLHIFVFKNVG